LTTSAGNKLNIVPLKYVPVCITCCSSDGSLILVAGDSGMACKRFNDTWQLQLQLQPTSHVAAALSACWQQWQQQQQQQGHQQEVAGIATQCGSYTGRSNAAATVAAEWLVLFGGWETSGAVVQK
jgi:hypothetical protein